MMSLARVGNRTAGAAKTGAALIALAALAACANNDRFGGGQSEQAAVPPPVSAPPPGPASPPPIDLAGRWKLAVASGGCVLTLTANPGAAEGSVAPAGGCPGNFFTSRKWTFDRDMLVIRDHKGEPLAELAFADGRFEGKSTNGTAVLLARP
jgi:hypothetical protein